VTPTLTERVEAACRELLAAGEPITFDTVAESAGIGRATLYRRPELRALVEEHRQHARDALTLTGLAVQIDQLRNSLDAVAANVRRHEEQLRKLAKTHTNKTR
jgi:hypothetical protein